MTRVVLTKELAAMQADLLRMSSLVQTAIERSMQAFLGLDSEIAERVISDDGEINRLRFAIEDACLQTLATQQPAARDLRMVLSTMTIATELERMGDHATGIAKLALRVQDHRLAPFPAVLQQMGDLGVTMLRSVITAFAARDAQQAYGVANDDEIMDAQYQAVFHKLAAQLRADKLTTDYVLALLFAAHNLERIGDRIVNICERVIFASSGQLKELDEGERNL
ncbi:MAG: phosphate transport system regulatory protein PhoU [Chloroflexi bacterium]|nr:MAG: phosphate transport system regulatory protein PhoU [Chloroflexota bacterium]RLT53069.1 MAG: phosphate transport system regulatory protein PhoU [Chloroflexota bacterium]